MATHICSATFSGDGKHLAYALRDGEKYSVIRDGRILGPFDGIHSMRFSPDGAGFAFVATTKGRSTLMHDDKLGPSYDEIQSVEYIHDGKRLILVVKVGEKFQIVFDDQKSEPTADWLGSDRYFVSRDGTKVAFGVRVGRDLWWKVLRCK